MEIEILKEEKNEIELKVDNVTIAEVLRIYLGENDVDFVAWKRAHPSEPANFKLSVSKKTAKKAISDAVSSIKKDLSNLNKILK